MDIDIRQSDNWANFLKHNGWKTIKFNNGYIYVRDFYFFKIAKIQRHQYLTQNTIEEILKYCKDNRVIKLYIEPKFQENIEMFTNKGFKKYNSFFSPTKTLIIDLNHSVNELHKNLSKSCKYSINRASRNSLVTKYINNPNQEDINSFYNVLKNSPHLKDKNVNFNLLNKKARAFNKDCFIISVLKNSETVSCGMFLTFNKTSWYAHGATSIEGRKLKAGYLLFWEAIKFFKQSNFSYFNFDGIIDPRFKATKDWEGFSNFKKRFGGYTVVYPSPLYKWINPYKR